MESLKDRVVIVTGSSSGIGASCIISCAKYGSKVVICGRNQQRIDEVAKSCRVLIGDSNIHCVKGDLSTEENICQIIDSTIKRFGRIDVLIHCAGYSIPKGVEHAKPEDLRELWHLHITVPFLLVKLSLPYLSQTRGNVVVISSLFGTYGMRMNLPYSVTKAAQNEFVRLLSEELKPRGIRVNAIQPGWVRTGIIEHSGIIGAKYFGELLFKACDLLHPIGRCGTSDEIGEYTAFVASSASSSVNGQLISIDGGGKLPFCLTPKLNMV